MEYVSVKARIALGIGVMLLTSWSGLATAMDQPVEGVAQVTLPDGRHLETGGIVSGQPSTQSRLLDGQANLQLLPERMIHPRSGHSATVLPNGKVLIWGGEDRDGNIVAMGEWFDPSTGHFSEARGLNLLPRSGHTATVLTDGRMLLIGGRAERLGELAEAEVWDWRANVSELLPARLEPPRERHHAELLADGRVLVIGPAGLEAALYDPGRVRFLPASGDESAAATSFPEAAPRIAGSLPNSNASNVATDSLLALRFEPSVEPASASARTITLVGPHGQESITVVPAEAGRLVFVTPIKELFPGSHYTLIVQGVRDVGGREAGLQTLEFDTASFQPNPLDSRLAATTNMSNDGAAYDASIHPAISRGSGGDAPTTMAASSSGRKQTDVDASSPSGYTFPKSLVIDSEVWTPGASNLGGRWRSERLLPSEINDEINLGLSRNSQKAAWRSGRLRSGTTMVSGRVLKMDDLPLPGVEVSIGERRTLTNALGYFELAGIPAGHQQLVVDGSQVGERGESFAEFVIGVDVVKDRENPVKPVFLPKIRPQDWIEIPSPLTSDLTIRNPMMPGFEVHLPAGTILRGRDGKVVRRIAVMPMPLERTPINYPVNTPLHMTFQPGGMSLEGLAPGITKGIHFVYPNYGGESPGSRAGFLNYDPVEKGWYTYGYGTVSKDGLRIVPDDQTQIYTATGFGIFFGAPPPPTSPPPGCGAEPAQDGDPVDLRTGLFKHSTQGPGIADVLPISWRTTYRPGDAAQRAFGKGTSDSYGMYLYTAGDAHAWEWSTFLLVMPDCSTVKFDQVAGTAPYADWLATHVGTPSLFYGATLVTVNGEMRVTRRDGMRFDFNRTGGQVLRINDRLGRSVEITRNSGRISRVTTESGRYVDVLYDSPGRITKLTDFSGRQWLYHYDTAGYLDKVTYPDTTFETFSYDALGRMTDVVDRRGNSMVHNGYDAAGRVADQLLSDGATFHFDYTTDAQGVVTRTDVTQPNGSVRRVEFHTSGYPISDTEAYGTPLQRTTTYERDAVGFITATVDPLLRRTEFTYDSDKQLIGIRALAGTAQARDVGITYTDQHDVASVTDPYGQSASLSYDARRRLTHVEDSLGRYADFEYDDRDRLTRATDHLGRITSIGYDLYDVSAVTDPLLRTTKRFTDQLGRLSAVEDPLGLRTEVRYTVNDDIANIIDPAGKTTVATYDAMGNLLTLKDSENRTTTWTYDSRQRVLTHKDALNQTESWTYAPNETGMTHTDRASRLTTVALDPLGRIADVVGSDMRHWVPSFDIADRLLSLNDSAVGTTSFTYNAFDQLLTETGPAGDVTYTYDSHDRLASRALSGQGATTYGYDARDRLTSLTQGAETVGFGYDSADRRTTTTLPNGVKTTAAYDPADRLTALAYTKSGTTLGNFSYGYDTADRLISRGGSFDATPLPAQSTVPAQTDANHRLTGFEGRTLTYDAVGNLVSDGTRTYQYDALDQLVGIEEGGTPVASFSYDSFGRRLSKTVDGTTTTYRYDGDNAIESTTGTQVSSVLAGPGLDDWYATDDAGGRRYLLTDLIGSTVALTDASGAITTRYDYSPYGEVTSQTLSGTPSTNALQYTGRENDGTGLYYYRARYYSPEFKRFTQEDPLGFVDGPNPYAYVGGSPLDSTDSTGQFIDSVRMACAQHPVLCDELGDEIFNAKAKIARKLGDECEAQYWEAVGGLKTAAAPFLLAVRLVSVGGAIARSGFVRDFASRSTRNWSGMFKSEGEARALARAKLGRNPVEVAAGKWRSADGKWQYRAKPSDLLGNHIHLEELNPRTGEVLQNLHLRWPSGMGR